MTARPSQANLLIVFYADPDRYPPTYSAACLLAQHFRVRLICRNCADPPSMAWPDGVRVDRIGPRRTAAEQNAASPAEKAAEYLRFVWAVRSAVSAERPRIVYAYEPHALVALKLGGCRAPVVYQRHDLEELGPIDRRSLQGWVNLWARRLGRSADVVVMPEKQRLIAYQRFVGDGRPGMVIPNFPLRASFPAPDDWGRVFEERARRVEVIFRGAIGSDNGVLEMVRALPHLDASISLRLFGKAAPDFLPRIEAEAATLGVTDRVRYEGFVDSYARLNRETRRASVGVVLHRAANFNWQNLGSATNKLYEYAASGLPVVVPDRPSFREFLEDEPWVAYADAADPGSVARAIEGLREPEGYEARCLSARRAFEERFNYEVAFQPLLSTVLALTADRAPAGAGPDA